MRYLYSARACGLQRKKKRNQTKFFCKSTCVTVPHYLRTGKFWYTTCPWCFWPFSTTADSKHQDLVCCSAAYYAAWHTLHATYLKYQCGQLIWLPWFSRSRRRELGFGEWFIKQTKFILKTLSKMCSDYYSENKHISSGNVWIQE